MTVFAFFICFYQLISIYICVNLNLYLFVSTSILIYNSLFRYLCLILSSSEMMVLKLPFSVLGGLVFRVSDSGIRV